MTDTMKADDGNYTCIAENELGHSASLTALVTIRKLSGYYSLKNISMLQNIYCSRYRNKYIIYDKIK